MILPLLQLLPFPGTTPTATTPPAAPVNPVTGSETVWRTVWHAVQYTHEKTGYYGWMVLLIAIIVAVFVGHIIRVTLRGLAERLRKREIEIRATAIDSAAGPAALLVLLIGLATGLSGIAMSDQIKVFVVRVLMLILIIAIGWFAFNLIDVIDLTIRRYSIKTKNRLDEQIGPLVRKSLRLFLVIVLVLFTAESVFNRDVSAWLAGLGIAGLAVTLAAQDSIKNLFGSITVLLDRPYAVGDRIIFDGHEGPVLEIGFRSTKLRQLKGPVVTIPNSRIVDGSVVNVTRRPNIIRIMEIGITYDTPPAKVERAVEIVKAILAEPDIVSGFDLNEFPPRVFFEGFAAANLNIKIWYWWKDQSDWWGYMAHSEQVNMRLLRSFEAEGIDFAFPTQTVYLAGDPKRPLMPPTV